MKPKYFSLVLMLVTLVAVGLFGWFTIQGHGAAQGPSGFESIKPLSELNVPDGTILAEMDQLERSLHLLSSAPKQYRQDADLSVLGYVPVSQASAAGSGGRNSSDAASVNRVTLAFEGQGKRFCVIDRRLYPEGARLPSGAKIMKIESRRVLIANDDIQQWLVVDSLLETVDSDKSS